MVARARSLAGIANRDSCIPALMTWDKSSDTSSSLGIVLCDSTSKKTSFVKRTIVTLRGLLDQPP